MVPGRPARTQFPERNLDVLRAIAVLCVFVCHASMAMGAKAATVGWLGGAGVFLFFVHTSLVLMGSLERGEGEPSWVARFYIRRVFRIYPLALVVIFGMLLFHVPSTVPIRHLPSIAFQGPTRLGFIANATLTQNLLGQESILDVLWSLPVEIQMYLALPLCFLIARGRARDMLTLVVATIILSTAWLILDGIVPGVWRLSIFRCVPCFLGGITAYAILVRGPKSRMAAGWWVPLIALSLIACFVLWPSSVGGWLMCLALGIALPLVRELDDSWLTRAAKTVAQYSYAIYLLHVPSLRLALVLSPTASAWAQLAVAAGFVAVGSFACYHIIEHPMIQVGRRAALRIGRFRTYPSRSVLGAPQMENFDPLGE